MPKYSLGRLKSLSIPSYFLVLIIIISVGLNKNNYPQTNKNSSSLSQTIADNYGLKSFSDINTIQFTFNVKMKDVNVKREWKWSPKTGDVEFKGPDEKGKDTTIKYNRNKLDKNNALELYADKRFINDQYWLLFPFHLVWDKNVDIKSEGQKEFPISHKKGTSLIVQYKNDVGYTPNDAFVLFLDKDNMIKEWTYRPGGNKEKERSYTWEGNKKFDGITISTEHNGPANKFKVWFSDIKLETNH